MLKHGVNSPDVITVRFPLIGVMKMNKQTCPLCGNRQLITFDYNHAKDEMCYRCIKCKRQFDLEK